MRFAVDHPWVLLGALALGAAAAGIVWLEFRRRRRRFTRLGPLPTLERLAPADVVYARIGRRPATLGSAVVLAGVALAGPRWGTPVGDAETQGIDVVYAVDASLSMLAEDERPNRLERARQEARRLRALSRGDRVALVAFAGRSYILTPLTADDGALALFLDNLDPSVVGQPGSSLASALRQSVELLGPAAGSDRAVVVFTDGETFDERNAVLDAARRAGRAGVAVVFVAFGTGEGANIPIRVAEGAFAPKRDASGAIVTTRIDEAMLRAAADAAGGTLITADATDKASRVRSVLTGLRAERRRVQSQQSIPARFQWFLAPALALLLWDVVGTRRRRTRAVAVASAAVVVLAPNVVLAQARIALRDAETAYRAGNAVAAAGEWRRAVEAGDRDPRTLYNLGTAYLAADSLDAAIEVLERAAVMPAPSLRSQLLYNLGLAYLKRGNAATGNIASMSFRNAVRAYRSVLLENPNDDAARWNYELAKKQEQSASSSGGGSGQGDDPDRNPEGGALPTEQASQLLDAAARDERDVRERTQRNVRPTPVRGRDW